MAGAPTTPPVTPIPASSRQITWTYDGLYRLTGESWTGTQAQARTYTYDPAGNRLTRTVTVGSGTPVTMTSSYDDLNRLVASAGGSSSITYFHDLNGNRTRREDGSGQSAAVDYTYDTADRLVGASVDGDAVFAAAYDARTRRVAKTGYRGVAAWSGDAQCFRRRGMMLCVRPLQFTAVIALLALAGVPGSARAERARGVDVSQWQLDMNWQTAYDQGIRFAFVRSSRGGTTAAGGMVVDERFHENMQEIDALAAAGKQIYAGAYHFGRWDTIGPVVNNTIIQFHARDQAQHFYNVAGAYMTPGYLRPVLDLEQDANPDPSTPPLSKAQLSLWADSFMDHVELLAGVEPLIYSNTNFATHKVDASLSDRDLWLARYNTQPIDPLNDQPQTPLNFPNPYGAWNDPIGSTVPSHDAWSFWQYTIAQGQGAAYGAGSSAIDLDVANGDLNFVRSFLIPEPSGAALMLAAGFTWLAAGRRRRQTGALN